jgi:hypothetical protein
LSSLAVTILGLKFSGSVALVAVVVVAVVIVGIWYLATHRRQASHGPLRTASDTLSWNGAQPTNEEASRCSEHSSVRP